MEKVIVVNKLCDIDRDNIAPCRDNRLIAVNITQSVKDEKGFINYSLAIDDYEQCCEDYSSGMVKMYDVKDDEVEKPIFISKIIHDADIDARLLKEMLKRKNLNEEEVQDIYFSGIVTLVLGKEEEIIAVAYVYNYHNGYYCHDVYTTVNGNTEVVHL